MRHKLITLLAVFSIAILTFLTLTSSRSVSGTSMLQESTPTPSPLELEEIPVENNDDWEPYIQEFDGIPMALVPAGCFEMGSTDEQIDYVVSLGGERDWFADEQPVETICIEEPFWIDVYEVTNEQYGELPPEGSCRDGFSTPDQPRNCVNWFDATAHCEDRGGRLPTEAEWEYAARGPDSLVYPWGNKYDAQLVIGEDDPTYGDTETAPVGSRAAGASWVGALDMSGNVWEWVSSLYEDYPYNRADGREADTDDRTDVLRVLRGGSFNASAFFLRSADRYWVTPVLGDFYFGFRCARSFDVSVPTTSGVSESNSSIELATSDVESNAEWTPVIEEFDGVEMVLVPVGEFEIGSTDDEIQFGFEMCEAAADNDANCQESWFEDEGPTTTVEINEPFWLDRTEVTRAMYQECIDAGACTETPASDYSSEPNQPINGVTWFQAQAYCEWRDGRLPTEAEWEYAARGPDRLLFPWGNEFGGTEANHCDSNCGEADWSIGYNYVNEENNDGFAVTAPVGSFSEGASWVGALDMSGNVWEWTTSLYEDYPYDRADGRESDADNRADVLRVLRGGSFLNAASFLRSALRNSWNPHNSSDGYGFRCARSQ